MEVESRKEGYGEGEMGKVEVGVGGVADGGEGGDIDGCL